METQLNEDGKTEEMKEEKRKVGRKEGRKEMHFIGKCVFKAGDLSHSLSPQLSIEYSLRFYVTMTAYLIKS